mmetsp:Transcript_76609/g.229896  ORF Transcript_76609/g.229896 Transcript_76609/m.229896 type:complete len:205 (-) Transcript_76609:223-837(-)
MRVVRRDAAVAERGERRTRAHVSQDELGECTRPLGHGRVPVGVALQEDGVRAEAVPAVRDVPEVRHGFAPVVWLDAEVQEARRSCRGVRVRGTSLQHLAHTRLGVALARRHGVATRKVAALLEHDDVPQQRWRQGGRPREVGVARRDDELYVRGRALRGGGTRRQPMLVDVGRSPGAPRRNHNERRHATDRRPAASISDVVAKE